MEIKNVRTLGLGMMLLVSVSVFGQSENDNRGKKRPTIAALFKMMDKNEDAKLSLEEVNGPLKKDFETIDANEDGFLTKEELENAPKPERPKKR